MIALLKRFRLDFNDVTVMTDSERRPHAKKYVWKTFALAATSYNIHWKLNSCSDTGRNQSIMTGCHFHRLAQIQVLGVASF